MKNIKRLIKKLKLVSPDNERGETIVEVLISVAVISLVISGTFSIMRRSINIAIAATERNQANLIIESQIERLRYLAGVDKLDSGIFTISSPAGFSSPFCLNSANTKETTTATTLCDGTGFPANTNLNVSIVYNRFGPDGLSSLKFDPPANDSDDHQFLITVTWDRIGTSNKENAAFAYRLPPIALTSLTPVDVANPPADPVVLACSVGLPIGDLGANQSNLKHTLDIDQFNNHGRFIWAKNFDPDMAFNDRSIPDLALASYPFRTGCSYTMDIVTSCSGLPEFERGAAGPGEFECFTAGGDQRTEALVVEFFSGSSDYVDPDLGSNRVGNIFGPEIVAGVPTGYGDRTDDITNIVPQHQTCNGTRLAYGYSLDTFTGQYELPNTATGATLNVLVRDVNAVCMRVSHICARNVSDLISTRPAPAGYSSYADYCSINYENGAAGYLAGIGDNRNGLSQYKDWNNPGAGPDNSIYLLNLNLNEVP